MVWISIVAEVVVETSFALSPGTLGHAFDLGLAESVEAVHNGDADVDFGGLAVRVSRCDPLPEGFEVEPVKRHRFERTGEGIFASIRLRT